MNIFDSYIYILAILFMFVIDELNCILLSGILPKPKRGEPQHEASWFS